MNCKIKIVKQSIKRQKYISYSLVTISVLGSTASLIISTLTSVPLFVITILSEACTVSPGIIYKFNLEDKNEIK